MKFFFFNFSFTSFFIFFVSISFCQDTAWHHNSPLGLRTNKGYASLKNKISSRVVVAVIDGGVDVLHEDLQGVIWVNKDEIPNNQVDDDGNGYCDDVHGWNFLGNKKGEILTFACYEKVRVLKSMRDKYERLEAKQVSPEDMEEYLKFKTIKESVKSEIAFNEAEIIKYKQYLEWIDYVPKFLANKFGGENYTKVDVENWIPEDDDLYQVRKLALDMYNGIVSAEGVSVQIESLKKSNAFYFNLDYDDRALIGDNPSDFKDIGYGNNNVIGLDPIHGTHVAGIIAAVRNNNKGIDGIADNVSIMALRVVPDGDEHDKDVALAIRYAVNNGAKVINLSFGKSYSEFPLEVYDALKYANDKDVLLVHAAGNEARDIDFEVRYPSDYFDTNVKSLPLFLNVGASTSFFKGKLAAVFSNYGQLNVDLFAPGQSIYSTAPGDEVIMLNGTSMAAPMVSGVAALLKSYFPKLSMLQIKDILMKSVKPFGKSNQLVPGTELKAAFSKLSVSGGVLDIPNAIKLAKKTIN